MSQNNNHSNTIQNGEYHSINVLCISHTRLSYMNNANTKFIQAHINGHLSQNGIENFNTGCFFMIPNSHIIHQILIYQNNKANLSILSASENTIGITKKPISQKIKPIVFHIAILFINFDLNKSMII